MTSTGAEFSCRVVAAEPVTGHRAESAAGGALGAEQEHSIGQAAQRACAALGRA